MSKEKQIKKIACKNCIHYQMCVDTFRKSKQDGEILLIEEDAYFADANGCNYYADKRIYRKQSEGEWVAKRHPLLGDYDVRCSYCGHSERRGPAWNPSYIPYKFCPNCGAKMRGDTE